MGYEHERFWEGLDQASRSTITGFGESTERQIRSSDSIYYPTADHTLDARAAEYLGGRGLNHTLARGFGWYPARYNGPRLIVPCVRTDPYAFWQGRLIDTVPKELYCSDCQIDPGPNYQLCMDNHRCSHWKRWDSPSGLRGDALVYLTPTHLILEGPLLVVEGPLDALAIAEFGYDVVAILGATPPGVVLNHIAVLAQARERTPRVLWIPDKDAVNPAMKRQAALGTMGVLVNMQMLPGAYKDFAEIPREERKEVLEWLLQK